MHLSSIHSVYRLMGSWWRAADCRPARGGLLRCGRRIDPGKGPCQRRGVDTRHPGLSEFPIM